MEKDEAGSTRKDRLLQVYKTTGEMPPLLLEEVDLDCRVEPWYQAFLSLNRRRRLTLGGMGGAIYQTLTAREILDWVELENQCLNPFGLMIIDALDDVFVSFKSEQSNKKSPPKKSTKGGRKK